MDTLYVDFLSPADCAAAQWARVLDPTGMRVDVRAVQADPSTPVRGVPEDPDAAQAQLAELAAMWPSGAWSATVPATRISSMAPVSAYAEVYGSAAAGTVLDLMFRAYWGGGKDIGNPEVLRTLLALAVLRGHLPAQAPGEFGYVVSPSRGPVTTAAWHRVRDWHAAWQELGAPALPALVSAGQVLTGVDAVRELARRGADATLAPVPAGGCDLCDTNPISAEWVSQVGGLWKYAFREHQAHLAYH